MSLRTIQVRRAEVFADRNLCRSLYPYVIHFRQNSFGPSRGGWQRGLDPRFYDCTRKEIRPSETKYLLVENKTADVPSKGVVENLSRSSSIKSGSVTLYLLWIYFEENQRLLGWNQNG